MKNSPYLRSALAQEALRHLPPLIRKSLLEESSFCEEYGITLNAVLSFDRSGISVKRSILFRAVREIFAGASEKKVSDTDGRKWKLKNIGVEGELPRLELSRGKHRLNLPSFAMLSQNTSTRLRCLDEAASDVNLPNSTRDTWCNVLTERSLEDEEIDVFHSELHETPVEKARSIRSEIIDGQSSISSLVPHSRRYFERLVGAYDGSATIQDYATNSARIHFEQLSTWQPFEGFLFSLYLSSHSSLTDEINVDEFDKGDLERAYNFLVQHGDRISQVGAIEVGLRILPSHPEIEPILIQIIEQIRDDDINGQSSNITLFSALFLLVDGELSRIRLFSEEPPFYRRLAALSQAALIHRQLVNSGADIDTFCKWAYSNRGEQYYMQSLADMRLEPRWNPDLASASQIKEEFFGRIMNVARKYESNIKGSELSEFILTEKPGSIQSCSDVLLPYLPGPLEGAEESQNILPPEFAEAIESQVSAEDVGPSSFIALVNSALIFRIDTDHAELAAKALKLASYRLPNIESKSQLVTILNGLATVAAVTRSLVLADELRILVRRYRSDAEYALMMDETMRISLLAAASRTNIHDWREFVGDWLTELAFNNLAGDDGVVLHSHLQSLCHAVPELWVSCARADAALKAYNSI